MTDKSAVIHPLKVIVEAGELRVAKDDAIIPTKMRLLGAAGWSVVGAGSLPDGGFSLLLLRSVAPDGREQQDREAEQSVLHADGPRCPQYCGCATGATR